MDTGKIKKALLKTANLIELETIWSESKPFLNKLKNSITFSEKQAYCSLESIYYYKKHEFRD